MCKFIKKLRVNDFFLCWIGLFFKKMKKIEYDSEIEKKN